MSGRDDETWLGDDTYTDEVPLPSAGPPLLAGRYRVGRLLGRGGTGQVHEAVDTTSDEVVAIKFVALRSAGARRQLRQELTALRLLAVPGVVRLHDDGEVGDQTFLVMDLLSGGPFDALADRGWDAWQQQARALLEALARVHFAGVLHLDLKPGNVLLDGSGWPVITDFGLARGEAVHRPTDSPREGTPRYMAPEQRLGATPRPATDLYALGGVFWEMLAGRPLPRDPNHRVLPEDCAPAQVTRMVQRMLEEDPAARPRSAVEVLEALFDSEAVLGPADLGLAPASTAEELWRLFDEERPSFLYLARDAAALLHQVTQGEAGAVRRELDRWVRSGLAWWNGERLHIERPGIEQLRWSRAPESQRFARLARSAPERAVDHAVGESLHLVDDGEAGVAIGLLEAAMPLARVLGRGAEIACHLVEAAVHRPRSLERSLHHAHREGHQPAIWVGSAVRSFHHGAWQEGLRQLDRALATTMPESLRTTALASYGYGLRCSDLDAYAEWLGSPPQGLTEPMRRAAAGSLAYGRGRYQEAMDHHLAAAESLPWYRRVASWTNAAAAAVELPDVSAALPIIERIREAVDGKDAPAVAARAHWLWRLVHYRSGAPLEAYEASVHATAEVSPRLAAQLATVEAAFAWRSGDPASARMARFAARVFAREGLAVGRGLCMALEAAAGGQPTDLDVEQLASLRPAEFAVQALALVALSGRSTPDASELLAEALRDRDGHASTRLDVLSLDEARAALTTSP